MKRNGDPKWADLPWPEQWQAHPDGDLLNARFWELAAASRKTQAKLTESLARLSKLLGVPKAY